MSRASDQRYNVKMKRELAELHDKNRELKQAMARALLALNRDQTAAALSYLQIALGLDIGAPNIDIERMLMELQKAKQESEKYVG